MYVSTRPELTPDTVTRMTRHVAEHAHDAADARALLGYLGLPGGVVPRVVTTLKCGHPSTEGFRRDSGHYGVVCRTCNGWKGKRPPVEYLPTVFRPGCGTSSGYAVHRRAKEMACDDCLKAERVRTQERVARAKS